MVAPLNAAARSGYYTPQGVRDELIRWFQSQGINPMRNIFAQQMMQRAEAQLPRLMDLQDQLGGLDESQFQGFIQRWAQDQWGGGQQFGAPALRQQISQASQQPDSFFNSGDPYKDQATIRAYEAIANQYRTPTWQATQGNLTDQRAAQFNSWLRQNPTWSGNYSDVYYGRQPQAQSAFVPPASAAVPASQQTQTFTPLAATGAPQGSVPPPGGVAAGPGTPLINPTTGEVTGQNPYQQQNPWTNVGQPALPTNPSQEARPGITAPAVPQGSGAVTDWMDLIKRYGGMVDASGKLRGNPQWGTRGYAANAQPFSLGGVEFTGTGGAPSSYEYQQMSGTGRITHRGDPMGQFLASLVQYLNQRDRGGNPDRGVMPGMSNDQVAALVRDMLKRKVMGGRSGFR